MFNILQIRNYKGGTKNDRKGLHKKKCQVVRKVLCAQFFVLNMMRNGMSAQVFVLIIVVCKPLEVVAKAVLPARHMVTFELLPADAFFRVNYINWS